MTNKFTVIISGKPEKNLKKIPFPWSMRILDALTTLEVDPYTGEKMWGEYEGTRKIRIWPYRVIYIVDEKEHCVKVVEIGHRGSMGYK